ncbi:MAG TPA: DUF3619 family protein [Burkholderiales bacterium]|nr:DUF3619 family protein [Burkholderiales bacterium]
MTRDDLPERIARKLDEGLDELPPGVLYRLRLAREAALTQGQESDRRGSLHLSSRSFRHRVLVPTFVLALCLAAVLYWQQHATPPADLADLDAQVLSDELPVTAYLDQGFEAWLSDHRSTD